MKRCVISPAMRLVQDEQGVRMNGGLKSEDINYYILFWDRIVVPSTQVVHRQLKNEDELIGLGVITRPMLKGLETGGLESRYLSYQLQLLEEYRRENKGEDWSLHQVGEDFVSLESSDKQHSDLRIEIFNALPIPSENIPLADILEFKERRKQQFIDFHEYLDELYKHIISCPDDPLLSAKAYVSFEESLSTIRRFSEENWRGELNNFNFSFGFESKNDIIDAVLDSANALANAYAGDKASALKDVISIVAKNFRISRKEKVMLGSESARKGLRYLVNMSDEKLL
ncbi:MULTISPECIES: DUF6236 family protein [Enterobacter]|uniref:DUF6236 family protein n=1 Tax=Enterobacter TaxID=547 RepID=UPI001FFF2090|nr:MULTISPECIES: DUF6236 family protein [Enterobacter]MCK2177323.1 DUF6236 family protein [Enterobacter asburiae]MCK7090175.1 DUF6236 family protein [Enterobacter bugandensis]